jgi:hypothetical protein
MIDAVFIVVVLAESPETNTRKWRSSAFRDMWMEYRWHLKMNKGHPQGQPITEMLKQLVDSTANDLDLDKQQRGDPRTHLKAWPNPASVVQVQAKWVNEDAKRFLKDLYDTHYSDSSQMSHLALRGLSAGVLATEPEEQWDPGKFESDAVAHGMLFLVMLLSEIEASCRYGLATKIVYIWTALSAYSGEAQHYYETRYRKLLATA